MTASIVQSVMGDRFADLHPQKQWRFGFSSADHVSQHGVGVMETMSHSSLLPPPVLWFGGKRRMFPPLAGADVPFTIANYAYVDDLGRECLAFVRRFQFPGREIALDSVMVLGALGALDYIGKGPDMVVSTECIAGPNGELVLESGTPRFLASVGSITPPSLVSALTHGREWWDESTQRHRIEIEVKSPLIGTLFHYRGWFTAEQRTCTPADLPAGLGPSRTESRER